MHHLDETTVALFIERRLADDRVRNLQRHIDGCDECRQLVAELGRTSIRPAGCSAAVVGVATNAPRRGDRIGRYIVVDLVGSGAMGVVYAARDPDLDRKVAVKLLHGATASEAERTRLLREAQALARVTHPGVVAVHDVGTHDDRVYIAMEFVEGGTFKEWLRAQERPWRAILAVGVAAARGLAAAHAAGLVHRDVKPDNILVDSSGIARIGDFGLAAAIEDPPRRPSDPAVPGAPSSFSADLTASGMILGTPAYMAPEQLAGEPVTPLSDQFSFCATLYEALFGVRPYPGTNLREVASALAAGEIAEPLVHRGVPRRVRDAVVRGLAIDPSARHATMSALIGALTYEPWSRRRLVTLGLVAAAAFGVVAFGVVAFGVTDANEPDPCGGFDLQPAPYDAPAIRAGFARTPAVADRVLGELEAWRRRAAELRAGTCRASRVEGLESAKLSDLRMECIADSARRVAALGAELSRPTPKLVDEAIPAVQRATDLTLCESRRAVLEPMEPPGQPGSRVVFELLRTRLAIASAAYSAGRLGDAIAMARRVATEAATETLRAIEADAWAIVAKGEVANQQPLLARDAVAQALVAAEAAGHDAARAKLYLHLIEVNENIDRRDTERLLEQARELIERLGLESVRWQLLAVEGKAAFRNGDRAKGLERVRAAIQAHGETASDVDAADLLDILGYGLGVGGDFAAAETAIKRAIAIREQVYGPHSPSLIDSLDMLGRIALRAGRTSDAVASGERAFAIAEADTGRGPGFLHTTATNLAFTFMFVHRNNEALALLDRALVSMQRAYGADTTPYAELLEVRAQTLTDLKRYDAAMIDALAAVEIIRRKRGAGAPQLAQALSVLGRTQFARARFEDSTASFARALEIQQAVPNSDLFQAEVWIGESQLAAKRPGDALPHFERALTLRADTQHDPTERARAESGIARALIALGRARPRAIELLRRARAVFAATGHSGEQLQQVTDALAQLGAT